MIVGYTLDLFNVGFFLGMMVAKLILSKSVKYERTLMTLGFLLFFLAGIIESFTEGLPKGWWLLHTCYLFSSAIFILGVVSFEQKYGFKVPGVLLVMGKASYSIYLIHVIVLMVFAEAIPFIEWLPSNVVFFMCVVGTVVVGVLFSKYVEFPVMSKVDAWFKPKKPREA